MEKEMNIIYFCDICNKAIDEHEFKQTNERDFVSSLDNYFAVCQECCSEVEEAVRSYKMRGRRKKKLTESTESC